MSQVVRVIVNSNAKLMQDKAERDHLIEQIGRLLPEPIVLISDESSSISVLLERALSDEPDVLVACGGDGTINTIASMIVGTKTALGVLPLGTLNHFAGDIGIPSVLDDAIAVIAAGFVRSVDVGAVNGRIFLNNAGLGLYPQIVHQREARQRRGASKWPAAVVATVKALSRYRRLAVRIFVDGKVILRRTPAVMIGNNEYSTDYGLEPRRESLDNGLLSLYVPRASSRFQLVWFSIRALLFGVRNSEGFEVSLTNEITIESKHRHLRVSLDGEVTIMETPLQFESRPRALRVIAPAEAAKS